jgi:hypothetical protein
MLFVYHFASLGRLWKGPDRQDHRSGDYRLTIVRGSASCGRMYPAQIGQGFYGSWTTNAATPAGLICSEIVLAPG